MVKIKNASFNEFIRIIEDKEVIVFGAGKALESCMTIYFEDKEIAFVVDNDKRLWDTQYEYKGCSYFVRSIKALIEAYKKNKDIICFIDTPFFANDIVDQLDSVRELDGLQCYIHLLIRNTCETILPYEFTSGTSIIPKKIHYIWVGGKEVPKKYRENIETWKKYNPDYEIICWNEKNYDFMKDDYTRVAYSSSKWGFVPNYARLDIVSKEGGIYLDIDVEAIANFDKLLCDNAFFNMGCSNIVNRGCGFGAVKGATIVEKMKAEFQNSKYIDSYGHFIMIQDHIYSHPVLKRWGFKLTNQYQRINSVALYPSEVMSPLTIDGFNNMFSDKTVSIHLEDGSWKNRKNSNAISLLIRCNQIC